MESAVNYILKRYFDDYIASHGNVDLSAQDGVTLRDLELKHENLRGRRDNDDSGVELNGGKVGSLCFKALDLEKVQVIVSDLVFEFKVDPMKAMRNAIRAGQEAAAPGFVDVVSEDKNGNWDALFGQLGHCATAPAEQRVRPLYCGLHYKPERRGRGPARIVDCKGCGSKLRTNYTQCVLCPLCSRQARRCVMCADPEIVQTQKERENEELAIQLEAAKLAQGIDVESTEHCGVGGGPQLLQMFECGRSERNKVRQTPRGNPSKICSEADVEAESFVPCEQIHVLPVERVGAMRNIADPAKDFKWSSIPPSALPRTLTGDNLDEFLGGVVDFTLPLPESAQPEYRNRPSSTWRASAIDQVSWSGDRDVVNKVSDAPVCADFSAVKRGGTGRTCPSCGQAIADVDRITRRPVPL